MTSTEMEMACRRVTVTYCYTNVRKQRTDVSAVGVQTPRTDRRSARPEDDGSDAARQALAMSLIPAEHVDPVVLEVRAESIWDWVMVPEEAFEKGTPEHADPKPLD